MRKSLSELLMINDLEKYLVTLFYFPGTLKTPLVALINGITMGGVRILYTRFHRKSISVFNKRKFLPADYSILRIAYYGCLLIPFKFYEFKSIYATWGIIVYFRGHTAEMGMIMFM